MGAAILDVVGDLVSCKVWGTLTQLELSALQREAGTLIRGRDSVCLLVVVEDFAGWEHGEWSDFSFQAEHDTHIARMALVGEQRWEDLAEAFVGKGLREFPIEYFSPSELSQALRWLAKG